MGDKKVSKISLVLIVVFLTNLLPINVVKALASTVNTKNQVTYYEDSKSNYGPHEGETENKKAVEPFKQKESLDGVEYSKDTLLIKVKEKKGLFTKSSGVKHSKIEKMEEVKIKNINTYSNGPSWYKAKLTKDASIEQVLNDLKKDKNVLVAEPEYIRKLDTTKPILVEKNPSIQEQWYLDRIGINQAWDHLSGLGINPGGSRDVVVAVIDTGVDYNHSDLALNIWTNSGEIPGDGIDNDNNGYVDDYYGIDTTDPYNINGNPMDDNGHGTHVAGIIAAQADNGIGSVGIAHNVKIMPIKAAQSSGILTSTSIAKAVLYAAENGADVINMSFGGSGRSQLEEDALADAFTTSVLVAAAGNDSLANEVTSDTPLAKPMYPAAYSWVLGVMSSSPQPNKNGDWLSSFSNWDIKNENSIEYELMAPGDDIYSTLPGDKYAKWDGTSMASPMVAGVAALLRSKFDNKESHSSRFIMGQLASTGDTKQGKTYSIDKKPLEYKELNAFSALTNTPKPKVTYMEHYIFDKANVAEGNDGDGVVDAGETIDLGMIIRNHWGKADDVTVKIDTNSTAGITDPYVELLTDTVNFGAIGNFGTDDNGFIYESDEIVGVNNPFKIKIKENAPNDHMVKININLEAKNGLDTSDNEVYREAKSISFIIRKGTELPGVIDKDRTLTKDNYWIIPNATVIEEGVTVRVEPGTQIQFWSSEPDDPYAEKTMAYLQVKGNLIVNGTAEEPVEMFASEMWRGYEVKIFSSRTMSEYQESYNSGVGNIELNYAKISNPNLNVEKVNNCYFSQDLFDFIYKRYLYNGIVQTVDYYGPRVLSKEIKNSKFYKLGYKYYEGDTSTSSMLYTDGKINGNIFDNCVYYMNNKVSESNVFLNNYKLKDEMYGDRQYLSSVGNNFGNQISKNQIFVPSALEKFNYTGSTYFILDSSMLGGFAYEEIFKLTQEFAQNLGGYIVTINNEMEEIFIKDYIKRNISPTDCYNRYATIGLNDIDGDGNYTWISGEKPSYEISVEDVTNESYKGNFVGVNYQATYTEDWVKNNQIRNIIIEIPGTTHAESVTLNYSNLELGAGGTSYQLIPSIYPENTQNKKVTWESSNPEIVTVDEKGVVTPIKEGNATITVTTEDGGHTYKCDVLVKKIGPATVPTTGIEINKTEINLEKNKTEKLIATVLPLDSTDKRVVWVSSNEEIVTVDSQGNIEGKVFGEAIITVKSLDGEFTATCKVNVVVPVTGIKVDKEFIRLILGEEGSKLNAQVIPSDASVKDITWSSSDEEIATVNKEGIITPLKAGTIMVTAMSKEGEFKQNIIVTVWDKQISFNPIKIDASQYNTLILNDDGSLWVTGSNYGNIPRLLDITSIDGKVIDIAIDRGGVYILTDKGLVYEKGISSNSFYKINTIKDVVDIDSGVSHLLVLKRDGSVWAKGSNNDGQIGDGTKNYAYELTKVKELINIVSVSAGGNSSAAVDKDGSLFTWGENTGGKLGHGDIVERIIPTKVSNVNSVKDISVNRGDNITYITKDGRLYHSGTSSGQESYIFSYIDNNVISTSGSVGTILYVKQDGSVYVKGFNDFGQLGMGLDISSYVDFTLNGNIQYVKRIYSGDYHNLVLKNDGTIYAFGNNQYGQLGNMTNTNSSLPVEVLLGILPDDKGPEILQTTPADQSTGVDLNQTITIKFDETIVQSNKYGQIKLKDSKGSLISLKDKKIDGKFISFSTILPLKYGETYTVEIPSESIKDLFGNNNQQYSFTFRTKSEGLINKLKKIFSKEEVKAEEQKELSQEVKNTIRPVEPEITLEQINEVKKNFLNSDRLSKIKNNAILNRWHDPKVDRWMRFTSQEGDNNTATYLSSNYWGTTNETLIEKSLIHYNDFKNLQEIKYAPVLTEGPEKAYPFVTNIQVKNADGTVVSKVGAEKVKVHVTFNRSMNTSIQPKVTFRPDMPTTDYKITPIEEGGWISEKEWVGEINITPLTGDGYQFFRVVGAQAKDNPWLVTGDDRERFKFEIITSGTESMNLQAQGNGNRITLSWFQDDFNTLAGYNVYRSETKDGEYKKINKTIIPSQEKEYEDSLVEPGKTYYYKFTVLQTDMTESDYSNIASAAAVDSISPEINHKPVTDAIISTATRITAEVRDNVKVDRVTLYYRKVGEQTYKKKEMLNLSGNKFVETIEGQMVTSKGVEYYIEATDGISTITSGSSTKPHRINVEDKPRVTNISPNEGSSNGGSTVVLSGVNFKEDAKVKFNGVDAKNVVVESSTRISLETPAGTPGKIDITVVNQDGGSHTLYSGFTYKNIGTEMSIPNFQGQKGSTIEVPIKIKDVDGLSSIEFTVNYDSELLEFDSVRQGELASNFMISHNQIAPGKTNISMALASQVSGTGNVAYIKFRVSENSTKNECIVSLDNTELNGGAIVTKVQSGTFRVAVGQTVQGGIYYYYNGMAISNAEVKLTGNNKNHSTISIDGRYNFNDISNGNYTIGATKSDEIKDITSYDASLVLQYATGSTYLSDDQKVAADVNNDGKINAVDASLILQYASGKSELPFKGSDKIWKFVSYNNNVEVTNEWVNSPDLRAILVGDVSGNWGTINDPDVNESKADFNIGQITNNEDGTFTLPVVVSMNMANLFGTDIVINYDSSINTLIKAEKTNNISSFGMEINTSKPGEVKVSLAGGSSYSESGNLINLTFKSSNRKNLVATTNVKIAEVNENSVEAVIYASKDVNEDKEINIMDLSQVASGYNSKKENKIWNDKYDINRDGIIDIYDLIHVARNIE